MKPIWIPCSLIALLCLAGSAVALDGWQAVTLSDSVIAFGPVSTGDTHSVLVTLTNNLTVPIQIVGVAFEEDVFSTNLDTLSVPAQSSHDFNIYFYAQHNIDYTDFLRIELDRGVRPLIAEISAQAEYPDTYYSSTQNLWAEDLKSALTEIIDDHNSVGYTTARDSMYGHIDNDSGWVECVYTGRRAFFSTRQGANDNGFNCEHTWPQSFSGEMEPMKSDIFHLYPSDATANNNRANLDFGIVTSATWSQGGSKLGTDSEGQTVFEPRDVHKGNVARTHFYYIIRYEGNYNGYQNPTKMESHFRTWHISDPVDSAEQQRCEDIFNMQYNRNPFIDHPELADRISSFFGTATRAMEPEIAVAPSEVNLGIIGFDTTVHYWMAVANSGDDTLNVTSISSTDPDFDLDKATLILAPESYEYVRIGYTSGDTDVTDSTTIVLLSDDDDESLIEIAVTVEVSEAAGLADNELTPSSLRLFQNYPNPFHRETTIAFQIDQCHEVDLRIYNVEGQLLKSILHHKAMSPGRHRVVFSGTGLPSGIYYYRLMAGGRIHARRMVLLEGAHRPSQ